VTHNRKSDVEQFIQLYRDIFDSSPDRHMLQVLSDYLLHEELTNGNAHKSSAVEYPILSNRQLKRRKYGEHGSRTTNQAGEVALERASRYGVDGREHRLPVRRSRTYTNVEK